jgi:predicted O-methyltransferase YrrM
MNEARRAFLDELYAHGREHDAAREDRLQRLRNVEPETAELLGVLVRAQGARRVLEIGTSNGYSTLWLGDACERVGAELVSVDVDRARQAEAAEHLREARLDVTLRAQDGGAILRESPDAAWELVFLDAERGAYAGWWPDLRRTLAPGGLLAIDNVLSHEAEVAEVTALIAADDGVESTVVPVGAGVRLVVRRR